MGTNTEKGSTNSRLAYSLEELAGDIGVSVGFLRLEITRGQLVPTRLGRRVIVAAEEVRRYLAANSAPHLDAPRDER
jgi:hypothetical protein